MCHTLPVDTLLASTTTATTSTTATATAACENEKLASSITAATTAASDNDSTNNNNNKHVKTSRRRPSSFETYQAKHNTKRRRLSVLGSTTSSTASGNASPTSKARKTVRFTSATLNTSTTANNTVTIEYHEIPSRHSLTAEELDLLWYKKSQLKALRQTAIALVRQWEQEQLEETTTATTSSDSDDWSEDSDSTNSTSTTNANNDTLIYCWRGLEKRTRQGAKEYRATRQKGIRTVLLEQARQRSMSIFQATASNNNKPVVEEQWLAQVYTSVSATSKMGAQQRGMEDAQEASKIYWTLFGDKLLHKKNVSTTTCSSSVGCGASTTKTTTTTSSTTTIVAQ